MKFNRFLWETIKLKTLIHVSKTLPSKYKPLIKSKLITEFEMKGLRFNKHLFCYLTRADAYDLFTSSILAIHYKNWLSVEVILRSQIEILLFSNWLAKNTNQLKDIFNKEVYKDNKNLDKYYKKEETDKAMLYFWELYNKHYSQKAHPLPARYLSSIDFMTPMIPRKENMDLSEILNGSFNKLPEEERKRKLEEWFTFEGYSPGVTAVPHVKDKKRAEYLTVNSIYLYTVILENLNKIEDTAPEFEMKKEDWERAIRKYRRSKSPGFS